VKQRPSGNTTSVPDRVGVRRIRSQHARWRGNKALKGRMASRERFFAGTGNVANPMVGSRVQHTDTLMKGANRRGGEKPRGRNTVGVGRRRPEGRARKGEIREWTPSARTAEGRSSTTPREAARRESGERQEMDQRRERRRQRSRGSSHSRLTSRIRPRKMTLEVPRCTARAERSEGHGGRSRTQHATTSPGAFPTVGEPISRASAAERSNVAETRRDRKQRQPARFAESAVGSTVVWEAERRQKCQRLNP